MNLPNTTAVTCELASGWLTIWFDQPESRNALGQELTSDLVAVLEAVRNDRAIRGITLRGRGGIFCAGGDLKAFKSNQSGDRTSIIETSTRGAAMFDLVNSMPQVVIAVIEGAAMAGGLGLACCADVVICQSDAKFALTETAIGLSPAQIAPFIIQKFGYANGRRLMLTAARFNGRDAKHLGLVDFLADDESAIVAAETQIKKQVLACAPGAVAATKALILAIPSLDRQAVISVAAETFGDCIFGEEGREGISSFVEKRKPAWVAQP